MGFDRSRELVVEREVGKCTLGPSERISLAWAGNTLDIALYIMPASCSTYYEQKIYTAQQGFYHTNTNVSAWPRCESTYASDIAISLS